MAVPYRSLLFLSALLLKAYTDHLVFFWISQHFLYQVKVLPPSDVRRILSEDPHSLSVLHTWNSFRSIFPILWLHLRNPSIQIPDDSNFLSHVQPQGRQGFHDNPADRWPVPCRRINLSSPPVLSQALLLLRSYPFCCHLMLLNHPQEYPLLSVYAPAEVSVPALLYPASRLRWYRGPEQTLYDKNSDFLYQFLYILSVLSVPDSSFA